MRIYICSYAPVAGCIAPVIHRSRFGPLLACWGTLGDRVKALGGRLQPRGASLRCCDSAFESTVQRSDRTFPEKDRSGLASPAFRDGPGMCEPSGLRGLCIGLIFIGLLIL
jgi:hypothetical protein